MIDLVFATNNSHKLEEIKTIAGSGFSIKSLSEYNLITDIPEDFNTLEKNASQKAWFIFRIIGKDCFADDTGLEVEALDNEPGVYSARYSRIGYPVYPDMPVNEGNIKKLLGKLEKINNRKARFRTVISLIYKGREYNFEGIVQGEILKEKSGNFGFGYDPVFRPLGYNICFAEMDPDEKNSISHRAAALKKMIKFLSDA